MYRSPLASAPPNQFVAAGRCIPFLVQSVSVISGSGVFAIRDVRRPIRAKSNRRTTMRCSGPSACSRLLLCAKVAPTQPSADRRRYAVSARSFVALEKRRREEITRIHPVNEPCSLPKRSLPIYIMSPIVRIVR
jgi:hypothetical protein